MRSVYRLTVVVLFLLLSIFLPFRAHANYESVDSFQSTVAIDSSALLTVVETIDYDFGPVPQHGIYRNIPIIFENKDGRKFKTVFTLTSVTNELGQAYRASTTRQGDKVKIKIGDPDRTITGKRTYVISYTISGAIQYFSDHDELYWNVVGNDWNVPIKKSAATVIFADEIINNPEFKIFDTICFTGKVGSTEQSCTKFAKQNRVSVASSSILNPGEGLTVGVSFPKGLVDVVELKEVADYSGLVSAFVIFAFLIGYVVLPIFFIYWWWKKGRDPEVSGPVVRVFDPPKNKSGEPLTPIELGALVDEVINPRDVSAEIVGLAIKKYIRIKEHKSTLGGLKKGELEFMRGEAFENDPRLQELSKHERDMIKALTLDKHGKVKLSSIKTTFPSKLKKLQDNLYGDMVKEGFFPDNPKRIRTRYMMFGFIAIVFGMFLLGIILIVLSRVMGRRTLYGAQVKKQGMGLKKFLSGQERQLEFQEEHYYLFEKLLPYAIVFGVAKVWSKRFEGMTAYKPEWYESDRGRPFTPVIFTNTLNRNLSTIQSSYVVTTTTSSRGFSSSFGGGGFSGGGFGGGGGGSW